MRITAMLRESTPQSPDESQQRRINAALAAYRPEFRLLRGFTYSLDEFTLLTSLTFPPYPFIVNQVPYVSVNLINISVEQAMLLHLDYEIDMGYRFGRWSSIDAYRKEVDAGGWLVADLKTRVRQPVPNEATLRLKTKIDKSRYLRSTYYISFSASCLPHFTAKGLAVFP